MCIELAYINTKHPDFTEAHLIHKTLSEGYYLGHTLDHRSSDNHKVQDTKSKQVSLCLLLRTLLSL
jgi:hypothetical protein